MVNYRFYQSHRIIRMAWKAMSLGSEAEMTPLLKGVDVCVTAIATPCSCAIVRSAVSSRVGAWTACLSPELIGFWVPGECSWMSTSSPIAAWERHTTPGGRVAWMCGYVRCRTPTGKGQITISVVHHTKILCNRVVCVRDNIDSPTAAVEVVGPIVLYRNIYYLIHS